MATINSGRFNAVYTSTINVPESNTDSIYFVPDVNGLYVIPTPGVPSRTDITGYVLTAAGPEGRVKWGTVGDSIKLGDLENVDVAGVLNNQTIVYNTSTSTWIPKTICPGGINTAVQFKYFGEFTGASNFKFDPNTSILTVPNMLFSTISNGIGTISSNTISNFTIVTGLAPPINGTDAANKNYVDTAVSNPPGGSNTNIQYNNAGAFAGSAALTFNAGTATLTAVTISAQKVTGLDPPVAGTDAVNKTYADTLVGNAPGGVNSNVQYNNSGNFAGSSTFTFNSGTGTLSVTNISTQTVTGLNAPVGITDAVNKNYVDTLVQLPGGATTNVQYNNAGSFAGSATLTFNSGTATLSTTNISATDITAQKVTGLDPPVIGTDAVNKTYVDSLTTPPGGVTTNIQYNNAGSFAGSSSLTYTSGTTTLTTPTVSTQKVTDLDPPTATTDATNKSYVDALVKLPGGATNTVQYNNAGTFAGSSSLTFNAGTATLTTTNISAQKVTGLNAPVATTDAVNKNYVDTLVKLPGGATTNIQYNNAGSFAGSATLTFNSGTSTLTTTNISTQKVTGLNAPVATTDATNKAYVDALVIVTPGGATTNIQYNNAGSFAGSATLTFNSGTATLSTTNISAQKVTGLDPPVAGTDAVNKTYADSLTTPPGGATTNIQYNNAGSFAGSATLTFNSGTSTLTTTNITAQKVTGLDPPVAGTDAVNKTYADTLVGNSPGGATTNIQYNNAGNFAGSATLTFDSGTATLTTTNITAQKVTGLDPPVAGTDAVNKTYADTLVGNSPGGATTNIQYNNAGNFAGSATLTFNSGTATLSTTNITAQKVTGLDPPVATTDATNKSYVDALIAVTPGGATTNIQYNNAGSFDGSATLTFNSGTATLSTTNITAQKVTGLDPPVATTDATNKNYVDTLVQLPGGATTNVQYNNAGSFAGSATLTFNSGTATLSTTNISATDITAQKVTGLDPPVAGTDAVNKTYADSLTTPPGGATTNIQYNNAGSFAGSATLTYNSGTTTLTTPTVSTQKVTDLDPPTATTDATNKSYVDALVKLPGGATNTVQYNNAGSFAGSSSLTFNAGTATLTSTNISAQKVTGLNAPVAGTDAVNKTYADSLTTPPGGATTNIQYNNAGSFAGSATLTFNSGTSTLTTTNITAQKVTGLNAPVATTDATNKAYVDALITVTPGGANTNIQYNDLGTFAGDPAFTYNSGTETLTVTNISTETLTADTIIVSTAVFNKFVFVGNVADFPTPVTGVITLLDGYTYYLTDIIDLVGNRIEGGVNTTILGSSCDTSSLTSTGLGVGVPLLSSVLGITLRYFSILNVHTALALDATGNANQYLDWTGVCITNCTIVGIIKTYESVSFIDCNFISSSNLTFDGVFTFIILDGCRFTPVAGQTMITLPVTLTILDGIRINICRFNIAVSSIGILYSTPTVPSQGLIITGCRFIGGSANYISGITIYSNITLFSLNIGILNSANVGEFYVFDNAVDTTIAVQNVFYKLLGSTTPNPINQKFTSLIDNRLTYVGVSSGTYAVSYSITLSASNNKTYQTGVYSSALGGIIPNSISSVTTQQPGRAIPVSKTSLIQINTNDYFELYVANVTDTTSVTGVDLNLSIMIIAV
jgi:hypothetical protein